MMTALMASCGFHLRGDIETPQELENIHISGIPKFSELYQEIKRVLQRSGSIVTRNQSEALSELTIVNEQLRKRVLSVDALGRAAEYELIYSFQFSVKIINQNHDAVKPENTADVSEKQNELVSKQGINLTRDFRFDPDNVLATEALERQVREEMIKYSVQQIMRRIRAQLKHKG